MTLPKYLTVDPRESDRKERVAMVLFSEALINALEREHPAIVKRLRALPNAMKESACNPKLHVPEDSYQQRTGVKHA